MTSESLAQVKWSHCSSCSTYEEFWHNEIYAEAKLCARNYQSFLARKYHNVMLTSLNIVKCFCFVLAHILWRLSMRQYKNSSSKQFFMRSKNI